MRPEQTIAWTVTASLKIRHDREERKNQPNTSSPKWINDLENSLLSNIYIFTGELNDDEIDYYLASEPKIYIDRTRGFFQSAQNIAKELGPALLAQIRKNPFKNLRKKF
jgi:hypothetical protein